jgi:hypothetical protein
MYFDPRELLARLGARSPILCPTPNDVPAPPAEAIAMALGMVTENRLGRELMCHLYGGIAAETSRAELHDMIRELIHRENEIRERMVMEARCELAKLVDRTRRHLDQNDQRRLDIANARLAHLRAKAFPLDQIGHWQHLREAVLTELGHANLCGACEGRGHSPGPSREPGYAPTLRACFECGGSGRVPVSDRQRAELLHRSPKAYRESWAPMYEWLFGRLASDEAAAVREFWRRLMHRDRPPEPVDTSHVTVEFVGEWGATGIFANVGR